MWFFDYDSSAFQVPSLGEKLIEYTVMAYAVVYTVSRLR